MPEWATLRISPSPLATTAPTPLRRCLLQQRAALRHPHRPARRTLNARLEDLNIKLRLLTRIAFGFRSPQALVALAVPGSGRSLPSLDGRRHKIPTDGCREPKNSP